MKSPGALLVASKEADLGVNTENSKYMFIPLEEKAEKIKT
jgi:hypothetical protein